MGRVEGARARGMENQSLLLLFGCKDVGFGRDGIANEALFVGGSAKAEKVRI